MAALLRGGGGVSMKSYVIQFLDKSVGKWIDRDECGSKKESLSELRWARKAWPKYEWRSVRRILVDEVIK